MTTSRVRFSGSGGDLAHAKVRARAGYARAHAAGALASPVIESLWTDTLPRAEGRLANIAAEMYRRSEHPFELAADRAKWPR